PAVVVRALRAPAEPGVRVRPAGDADLGPLAGRHRLPRPDRRRPAVRGRGTLRILDLLVAAARDEDPSREDARGPDDREISHGATGSGFATPLGGGVESLPGRDRRYIWSV